MKSGRYMNNHIYKSWDDAISQIVKSKEAIRKRNARLPIEEKLKIISELKQTGQWLRHNAKKVKKVLKSQV